MIDGGLSALFQSRLPAFHFQRVETGGTGLGIPDLNYCFAGCEGWVELKATTAWAVGLRPEQVAWLCRRARAGGRVYVAVRRQPRPGPRTPRCDELWLIPGGMAPALLDGGLRPMQDRPEVRCWGGGPACWDWHAVAIALTSPGAARLLSR
jgi:hypothetical protein